MKKKPKKPRCCDQPMCAMVIGPSDATNDKRVVVGYYCLRCKGARMIVPGWVREKVAP